VHYYPDGFLAMLNTRYPERLSTVAVEFSFVTLTGAGSHTSFIPLFQIEPVSVLKKVDIAMTPTGKIISATPTYIPHDPAAPSQEYTVDYTYSASLARDESYRMLVVTTVSAIVLMAVLGLSICFEADASDEDSNNAKERR
jgi:hypothetical protein